MPIGAVLSIIPNLANTVTSTIDQGKRRNFEMAVANLSLAQQEELNKKLANAKQQTDREAILASALTQLQGTRIAQETEKKKLDNNIKIALIIAGSVMVIGLIGLIIYKQAQK
jgi:preprotein translocase subunit Sss1